MTVFLYLGNFPASGQPLRGGMAKAVHGLAKGLAERGAAVVVLCESGERSAIQTTSGYEIESFSRRHLLRSILFGSPLTQGIERNTHQSIFILNGIWNPGAFLMSRLLHRMRVPYVVAPHDPYAPSIFQANRAAKQVYWLLAERRMLRQAVAVQVLDLRHRAFLRMLHVDSPCIAVPNGFATDDPIPDVEVFRSSGTSRLLYLGRIDAFNKGLDLLVDAIASLPAELGTRLTIQGPDWGDRTRLERQVASHGLTARIRFADPDYRLPSTRIVNAYDIFCLPSRFEGFGLSALEAMLAGKVVLVSSLAGVAPHVAASDCGVVVDPEVRAIRDGIIRLLERREEWVEMGRRGRTYVHEHLNWNDIAENAMQQYRSVLEGAHHAEF